ncbi:cytochrome-c peroxidase [Litoribrevibacter albus]|uniref:Methylamine utilization protein MauG n=1 Tax=Litoribrevibacter albus TaxID=1473156 RepID=A0AA37SDI7_9GAMM|nr:cytochrome c peroxidase [Litoribrevibacter albus]GLQ32960.1 methylamine utilization protein MauG [Litoribrevibacter albus]
MNRIINKPTLAIGNQNSQGLSSHAFSIRSFVTWPLLISSFALLTACGGGGGSSSDSSTASEETSTASDDDSATIELTANDEALIALIETNNLDRSSVDARDLPDIESPMAQLGMKLFYSKSLGGGFDSACVTCHHPVLGGGDDLSLPIGVEAVTPDQLGQGRTHQDGLPLVPRNAPTVYNIGFWDTGLFWDSRVESLGKEANTNGAVSGIRTPDSDFGVADTNAGDNLVAAQARFPVTSSEEMKTDDFENGSDNDTIRTHLAARIGDYDEGAGELTTNEWLTEFQTAFGVTTDASSLVTFDNIAEAIGEYERSMVFMNNPWRNYLDGDTTALTEDQKAGALLFFTRVTDGGAGCAACHNGELFSDGQHHTVAFPHFGPGKGDGNDDDFGRERETGNTADRYRFRTPSLLNVATTAPYGHVGAYQTLEDVVRHYTNPQRRVNDFFDDGGWCQLEQFEDIANCSSLYPNAEANSQLALNKLAQDRINNDTRFPQNPRLNGTEVNQLVAFLEALTDPCVEDRDCLDPWIPDTSDTGPDGNQLNAVDRNGDLL